MFIAFPFNLGKPQFTIDLNGIPAKPNADQLDGAAKDWYPLQRWVDVSDGKRGVTLVPLDAPLVHLGGITTGKWARTLKPEGPTIMSWALNNHWLVNFKSSQGGRIPLRYRLTTHRGEADPVAAARFAAEAFVASRGTRTSRRRGRFRISSSPSMTMRRTCPDKRQAERKRRLGSATCAESVERERRARF